MIARTRGEKIFNVVNIFLLGFFALLTLYPFLYTTSISLSTAAEAERNSLHIVPGKVSLLAEGVSDMIGIGRGSELPGPQAVLDWQDFLARLRSPVEAAKPSPALQIWRRMRPDIKKLLIAAPGERRQIED